MPSITSILGDPLTNIIQAASGIIGRFVPDPTAKAQATLELAKLQEQYQEKLLEADMEFAKQQAETIGDEAKSESWLARNWRPITMMVFVFIIFYNYILAQIFSLKMLSLPPDMWQLLKLGIGGYILGRSAEKIVPATADAIVKAKSNGDDTSDK